MTAIKDGWLVEPRPVFFDSEDAAWNFADVYGGIPVRAKRHDAAKSGKKSAASTSSSAEQSGAIGELTEDDFAS